MRTRAFLLTFVFMDVGYPEITSGYSANLAEPNFDIALFALNNGALSHNSLRRRRNLECRHGGVGNATGLICRPSDRFIPHKAPHPRGTG